MEIFSTVHGSRLCGLHNQYSDYDYFIVDSSTYARQEINGRDDTLVLSLNQFLFELDKGIPQSIEAVWRPYKQVNPMYVPLIAALRPNRAAIVTTMVRTIRALNPNREKDEHALELRRLYEDGYSNPALSVFDAAWLKSLTASADYQQAVNEISPITIFS